MKYSSHMKKHSTHIQHWYVEFKKTEKIHILNESEISNHILDRLLFDTLNCYK